MLLDLAPVALDTGGADTGAAAAYLDLAGGLADPAALLGTLGLDPIGLRARTGVGPDVASIVPLAQRVAAEHPLVRAIVVDGLPVHAAGGADAQELGFTMAAGVAYLRALTDAGLDVATAARLLEFRYAATDEQFPTIAKLRAARRLWARVLEACGAADAEGQRQHAVSAPTMFTRRDPYVNLLRGTIAGFAAGVGGADAVTVAPFDAAVGAATPFSRRVARNTQALLIQEAHLARVVDPAGGGWLVESLTDALARAGWAFFQEIEAAGGAVVALDSGLVAARVEAVRAAREKAVATRRTPITGVSEFPDLAEKPVERAPRAGRPERRPARLPARGAVRGLPRPLRRRGSPPPARARRRSWPRSGRSPATAPVPRSPATCWPRAASTRSRRAPPNRPRRSRPPGSRAGCRSRCSVPATPSTPNAGRPRRRRCGRPVRGASWSRAGSTCPASTGSSTRAATRSP